jgi:hypothetical protein
MASVYWLASLSNSTGNNVFDSWKLAPGWLINSLSFSSQQCATGFSLQPYISHISLGISAGLFLSCFLKISNVFLISLVRIVCPAHFIIRNLVNQIKYGKESRLPPTVAERSKAWIVSFARTLWSWVRMPLRAWMFGLYMRLFCVCVVLCLGRGLATSSSVVQGVFPIVNRSGNWKEARAHKGCRANQKTKSINYNALR